MDVWFGDSHFQHYGHWLVHDVYLLDTEEWVVKYLHMYLLGMALINPVKAILGTNDAFKGFGKSATSEEGSKDSNGTATAAVSDNADAAEGEGHVDLRLPKLIYISIQLIALTMGLYKCSTMGLLPLTSADWTSYIPQPIYSEHAVIPI